MVLIEAQVLIEILFTNTTFCALLRSDQNKVDNLEQEKKCSLKLNRFWAQDLTLIRPM